MSLAYRFYQSRLSAGAIWRYNDVGVQEIRRIGANTWDTSVIPEDMWFEDERIEYPDDRWSE